MGEKLCLCQRQDSNPQPSLSYPYGCLGLFLMSFSWPLTRSHYPGVSLYQGGTTPRSHCRQTTLTWITFPGPVHPVGVGGHDFASSPTLPGPPMNLNVNAVHKKTRHSKVSKESLTFSQQAPKVSQSCLIQNHILMWLPSTGTRCPSFCFLHVAMLQNFFFHLATYFYFWSISISANIGELIPFITDLGTVHGAQFESCLQVGSWIYPYIYENPSKIVITT